jgi:hypothetical protein
MDGVKWEKEHDDRTCMLFAIARTQREPSGVTAFGIPGPVSATVMMMPPRPVR